MERHFNGRMRAKVRVSRLSLRELLLLCRRLKIVVDICVDRAAVHADIARTDTVLPRPLCVAHVVVATDDGFVVATNDLDVVEAVAESCCDSLCDPDRLVDVDAGPNKYSLLRPQPETKNNICASGAFVW